MKSKVTNNSKIDMFKKKVSTPYIDSNYKDFCSKCSRYEECRQMNPECEHSKVRYC